MVSWFSTQGKNQVIQPGENVLISPSLHDLDFHTVSTAGDTAVDLEEKWHLERPAATESQPQEKKIMAYEETHLSHECTWSEKITVDLKHQQQLSVLSNCATFLQMWTHHSNLYFYPF